MIYNLKLTSGHTPKHTYVHICICIHQYMHTYAHTFMFKNCCISIISFCYVLLGKQCVDSCFTTAAIRLWEADLHPSVFSGYWGHTAHMLGLTPKETTETDGSHTQVSPSFQLPFSFHIPASELEPIQQGRLTNTSFVFGYKYRKESNAYIHL